MIQRWYYALIIVAVVAGAIGFSAMRSAVAAPEDKSAGAVPLLFNITSGKANLHAASMGLGLASKAAQRGHPVVVFLNVEGPQLAAKDLGDEVKVADFPPVKKLLDDLIAAGGKVIVCEHCAHLAHLDKASIIDGATIGNPDAMLSQLKTGMVSFSY